MESPISLASLREHASRGGRAIDGGAAFTPVRDDALLALVAAVEAARAVVWRKDPDGTITVVSGLEQLEVKLWAFS